MQGRGYEVRFVNMNKNRNKALAFFVLSLTYLFIYGLWIKAPLLDAIAGFSKSQQNWFVLATISPAWILFACASHFYYEHKKGKSSKSGTDHE